MSAGWVAGSVRARALARRRLGAEETRRLASCGSLSDALRMLAGTAYGANLRPEQPLAVAQREIAGSILWDLRVLAGWLPGEGLRMLRVLGAWFELANVDELLQSIAGRPAEAEFQLGALATAWPRLRQATSNGELRAALATSAWRDPGGESTYAVRLGIRARWASRAAALGDPARTWAAGAVALLVAGERFAAGRAVDPGIMGSALSLLGPAALRGATLEEMIGGLPSGAAWVLAGITAPAGLWRAEQAWLAGVERDGLRLLRTSSLDSGAVLGSVAVMACDAWRVRAALEIAARGGGPLGTYDELA
jgi:ATP synthase (C/AC39) subunit